MTDKSLIQKLFKVASNQQKILEKLAQSLGDDETVRKMVGGIVGTWLANNGVNAKLNWTFTKPPWSQGAPKPEYDYELAIQLSPTTPNVPVASPFPNLAENFKGDIVQSLAANPLLKDKAVKVDVDVVSEAPKMAGFADRMAIKLAQYADTLNPNKPDLDSLVRDKDAEVILTALPPAVKIAVKDLTTAASHDPNFEKEVHVSFHPGKASDEAFQGVESTIHKLQLANLLTGQSYLVKEIA